MSNADMPAMPQSVSRSSDGAVISSCDFAGGEGLSKREYFAALAMQGLLAGVCHKEGFNYDTVADDARRSADALLDELERTK